MARQRKPSGGQSKRPPNRRKWPSVEDQLAAARVVYGSPLEHLIRQNQDVALLRPEESPDDDIGIPLWLRVHYRKQHPELEPAPAGPVGDYPEALENVHQWMIENQHDVSLEPAEKGGPK
jgi:hypothetical protein